MPVLNNPRYEAVAQARAKGASQKDAVKCARLSPSSANRVCRRADVLMRVREINPEYGVRPPFRPKPFRPRKGGRNRVVTIEEIITDFHILAEEARASQNYREANFSLKQAALLVLKRDGDAVTKPIAKTKGQLAQDSLRDLNEEDHADEFDTHNGATPSLSEINRALGEFDNNPGDAAQAEPTGAIAERDTVELPEPDGDK